MAHSLTMPQQFFRFALVGAGGTAGHYVVLLMLVELELALPVVATTIGFAVGAVINYFLNHRYTFRSGISHWSGLPKFLTIAVAGMTINTSVMALLRTQLDLHYVLAQILATCAVLGWAFSANRAWTFNEVRR